MDDTQYGGPRRRRTARHAAPAGGVQGRVQACDEVVFLTLRSGPASRAAALAATSFSSASRAATSTRAPVQFSVNLGHRWLSCRAGGGIWGWRWHEMQSSLRHSLYKDYTKGSAKEDSSLQPPQR
ncbi:uncharacterized protein LOC125544482 isoform X2 [Triticum urartu]|uniref:uncharacterized protein LOC125527493 isoform X2 n=1 Tax=Triticum urartu TaxID=4572 RepID=UPI000E79B706|nr:uncharacterized protein LOC125527493 isoform X2 [Triticum urartu]XP_048564152.1 uncharacterized protein LOC125544482 isoform X2 [Triticum urartu]